MKPSPKTRIPTPRAPRIGMSDLLLPSIDQVLRMLDPLPERPKDVHVLRVSIRRLRARLSAFRGRIGAQRREELDDRLSWLSDQLAPVREWDVVIGDLTASPDAALQDAAEAKRRKALRSLHKSLAGRRALKLRRDLVALRRSLSDDAPADQDEQDLRSRSREAVVRRLKKFHERYEQATTQGKPEALHRLRLEAKKLRYTLEVLQQAWPDASVDQTLATLVELQDRLGAEQDATVERQRLASLGKAVKAPRRNTVARSGMGDLDGTCRRAMRQVRSIRIAD